MRKRPKPRPPICSACSDRDPAIAPDGRYYCFEVNPSPVFSCYEFDTGQQIAASIAALLMAASPGSPPVRAQDAGSPPASLATAS
jgi:hypothetical protein